MARARRLDAPALVGPPSWVRSKRRRYSISVIAMAGAGLRSAGERPAANPGASAPLERSAPRSQPGWGAGDRAGPRSDARGTRRTSALQARQDVGRESLVRRREIREIAH